MNLDAQSRITIREATILLATIIISTAATFVMVARISLSLHAEPAWPMTRYNSNFISDVARLPTFVTAILIVLALFENPKTFWASTTLKICIALCIYSGIELCLMPRYPLAY